MDKKFGSLIGALSLVLSVAIGAVGATAAAPATSALESAADNFLAQEAGVRHWTIDSQSLAQTSLSQTSTTITAEYVVTQTHLLNYATPADVPIMKGLLAASTAATGLHRRAHLPAQTLGPSRDRSVRQNSRLLSP